MSEQRFVSLSVQNLSVNDEYALCKSTVDIVTPVKANLPELLNKILAKLDEETSLMASLLNKVLKSDYTALLDVGDKNRDDCFSEIRRYITLACKSRKADVKAAGESFRTFANPYWNMNKKHRNTQTELVVEFLAKYNADENRKAQAATIGIAELFAELEELNSSFANTYMQRNEEQAAQTSGAASELKPTVANYYNDLCTEVELNYKYSSTEVIEKLFNEMNELRKKYLPSDKSSDNENES